MRKLRLKQAQPRFSAARDEHGVPHITADSWPDALYGLGFMHGLDRPTQILFARTVAQGRSAELIADRPDLVETDRFFRRAGLYLRLEDELAMLDDGTQEKLKAYCAGVNDGLRQAGRTLPMWAARFHPSPWDEVSVLLIGALLSFGGLVIGQQQNERLILELIHAGVDEDRLRELFAPALDHADFDLLRKVEITSRLSDEALETIIDLPSLTSSNAWAVGPERSATGRALLASDPHLEINRLPAIWYEAVLNFSGRYVLGATLPGCPIIAVGRTPELAWGVTYMKGDTTDSWIEECRPGDGGNWQYRREGSWHDFQVREEVIGRKNNQPEPLRILFNEQGTLELDPTGRSAGLYLSQAWVGDQPGTGQAMRVWLDVVDQPETLAAMDTVRHCPHPCLCWVFADSQGHIGLQGNGWFPQRPATQSGLLPIPAWESANHWRGRVPVEELPRIYDPPEGFIATANENINRPGGPQLVTAPVPDYRKRRIVERLEALPQATTADMQQLQYDVVSPQARDLLAVFLPHLPDGPLKQRLAAWDCTYHPESIEAALFTRLYRNILLQIFGQAPHEHGGIGWRRMLYLCTRAGYSIMIVTCIDRLLKQEESRWWADRDKGELIRRAAEELEGEPDVPWSAINSFHFANRFLANERVGRALGFHTAELAMPGCHATPFQGHLLVTAKRETSFAPSYHFVTDLGLQEAWTNLPGGPSESRFSPWYKSDVRLWQTGQYKRLSPDVHRAVVADSSVKAS